MKNECVVRKSIGFWLTSAFVVWSVGAMGKPAAGEKQFGTSKERTINGSKRKQKENKRNEKERKRKTKEEIGRKTKELDGKKRPERLADSGA